ncbi:M23 family metallopeptidase [Paenibacillus sp. FSL K6-1230]|uniref:M23 family metallopeptidase n=1 Tax=Paenibacillus sp. FSL K6-1230 TaxID=2921603 RepID=UPI0030FC322A
MLYEAIKLLIIPFILLYMLACFPFKHRIVYYIHFLFTVSYLFMLLFINDWSDLNYYFRPICVIAFLYSLLHRSLFRPLPKTGALSARAKVLLSLYGVVAGYQAIICVLFILSYVVMTPDKKQSVDLMFPLQEGFIIVVNGGMNASMNYHYDHRTMKYALDIARLTPTGTRKHILNDSGALAAYPIYENSVYSPVGGVVVEVVDGVDDNAPNELGDTTSNMIVIQDGEYYIVLLHLKKGSVLVEKNDTVQAGQVLAQVGNSGYSTEPHLHIHAVKDISNGDYLNGTSIPITFQGRYLKRNDVLYDQTLIFR